MKRTGEVLIGWFPDRPAQNAAPETRLMLLDALAPPRLRSSVMLRTSAGTAASTSARPSVSTAAWVSCSLSMMDSGYVLDE